MGRILEVKKINKTYHAGPQKVQALRNVTISVNSGDFLIITGRNGSGKTTLLRQLGLLDYPDSGQIYLNGQEVTHAKESFRTRLRLTSIGYIFQDYALIQDLTALENVALPAMMLRSDRESSKEATRLLGLMGMKDRMNNLPNQLSGGQQQKVAIARALVNSPLIVFADEPTANLDSTSAKEIMRVFCQLHKKGHTIMMVTHEEDEIAYGTRVIKMSDGRLI